MAEMGLVPSTLDVRMLPQSQGTFTPGLVQGVHIVIPIEIRDGLVAKLQSWFAGREEIDFVDAGVSDKQSTGYIILEWVEREIDPLFLAILRDEEAVFDYTTYVRRVATDDEYD